MDENMVESDAIDRAWHPPQLTVLGTLSGVTQNGTAQVGDGALFTGNLCCSSGSIT
jgi:hypothetical protein